MVYDFWIFVKVWTNYAFAKQKIFFWKKMQRRYFKSLPIHRFQRYSKRVSTKINEKFNLFENFPIYKSSCLIPKNNLKGLGSLRKAHGPVIIVRCFLKWFFTIVKTLKGFLVCSCFIYLSGKLRLSLKSSQERGGASRFLITFGSVTKERGTMIGPSTKMNSAIFSKSLIKACVWNFMNSLLVPYPWRHRIFNFLDGYILDVINK